jgi:predicted nuclease of predicted toxin-antitoxin system
VKLLIDMNLSPRWVEVLRTPDREVRHWSSIGELAAEDEVITTWARENGCVIMTQDLDFSAILFSSQQTSPSVVLLRTSETLGPAVQKRVQNAVDACASELEAGCLMIIDDRRVRIRMLPIA